MVQKELSIYVPYTNNVNNLEPGYRRRPSITFRTKGNDFCFLATPLSTITKKNSCV